MKVPITIEIDLTAAIEQAVYDASEVYVEDSIYEMIDISFAVTAVTAVRIPLDVEVEHVTGPVVSKEDINEAIGEAIADSIDNLSVEDIFVAF